MNASGDCLFGYAGRFPDDHSVRLLELGDLLFTDSASSAKEPGLRISGRHAGYVFVEAFQNIIRHRAVEDDGRSSCPSLFAFRGDAGGFGLYARNAVPAERAIGMGETLAFLAERDGAGLKALFMEGIRQPGIQGHRGAGLGWIEMLRRTGARPQWSFNEYKPGLQQFTLVLEQGTRKPGEGLGALMETQVWPWMRAGKVELFYAGRWSRRVEEVWIDLVRGEEYPRGRLHAGAEAWESSLSAFMPHLAKGGGVLIALHEGGTITVAGTMHRDEVAALRSSVPETWTLQVDPADPVSGLLQVLVRIAR